jgi:hypothetical protein
MEENQGISKLAKTLSNRVAAQGDANYGSLVLDFGEIQPDMSLLTNTYPIKIPASDYLVLEYLTIGPTGGYLTNTVCNEDSYSNGEHTHPGISKSGSHYHSVSIPRKLRKLGAGDRVLVAWVQNDAVVIGRINPASEL